MRAAAREHGIPVATLSRYVQRSHPGVPVRLMKIGRRTAFSAEEERELAAFLDECTANDVGVDVARFREFVGSYAAKRGVVFDNDAGLPSFGWVSSF